MGYALVALAVVGALLADRSKAADIQFVEPIREIYVTPYPYDTMEGMLPQFSPTDLSSLAHIRVEGTLVEGDGERFVQLTSDYVKGGMRDITTDLVVSFNSPGGEYSEGLIISDAIKAMNAATFIGPGDRCLSACAFAWLGGRQEIIRSIVWRPTRYLHIDGELGFHAPFVSEFPNLTQDIEASGGIEIIGNLFYNIATEAIREIQSRLSGWQIQPEFAFDVLGKGPTEFLYIDNAEHVYRNRFTILVDEPRLQKQIGALEALSSCEFILSQILAPADDYRPSMVQTKTTDVSPDFLKTAWREPKVSEKGDGEAEISVALLVRGRGSFDCHLTNVSFDGWRVSIVGGKPTVETQLGSPPDFTSGPDPYLLNQQVALGSSYPWNTSEYSDLSLNGEPFRKVPEKYRVGPGPSFNCGGEIDPSAEIICNFPILSQADAILGAIYREMRDVKDMKEQQVHWLREREQQCRSDYIDLSDKENIRMAGYCILGATLARIDEMLD